MALPQSRSRQPRALTASAVKLPDVTASATSRRISEEWQKRCLLYVDQVPELNYASRFYSRMLKRIRIFPAERRSDDTVKPIANGLPVDLLDRIQDPGGGRSQLQGSYGRLQFITGEGYLLGRDLQTDNEKWSFVWNEEVSIDQDTKAITWKPVEGREGITYPEGRAQAYRMWTPHPARSGKADSPMHSILDIAEELLILTSSVRATAVSRMVNGMMKVPSELSFAPVTAEDGDENPEANIFLRDMLEHITGVVENAGTPEAAAPFIAEGAAEFLDALTWMSLHNPATDYMERDLRKEAITRLAFGLDMPPEVLLGLADANHWTGRQITHDMWRSHGAPVAEQFCDDLSEAYLRPALKEMEFAGWEKVVVSFDDADVVVSPDRSEDADRGFDRGALGYEGYRKLKGISEEMKPSENEHREWLAVKLRAPQALGEEFLSSPQRGPVPGPVDEADPEEGPPLPGPAGVSRQESRMATARAEGAALMALSRCRELAGARLRSQQKAHPELFEAVDGQPNHMVAAIIGYENLSAIGIDDPLVLVANATDNFRQMLVDWGYSGTQADALSEMVRVHAARRLFDMNAPIDLPPGIIAQIASMKEVSDAGLR